MVSDNKDRESFAEFNRNAMKFQLFIVVVLTDRAEVRGGCPMTAVLSGHKVALLTGTVLLSVAPGATSPVTSFLNTISIGKQALRR